LYLNCLLGFTKSSRPYFVKEIKVTVPRILENPNWQGWVWC